MSQFLEVIEWFDDTGEVMAHRIPGEGLVTTPCVSCSPFCSSTPLWEHGACLTRVPYPTIFETSSFPA